MAVSNANEELAERVAELTDYFELWSDLTNRENESVYRPVIEEYGSFFETIVHSLLQGFSVVTYQLFETRPDSHSILSLLRKLEGDGHFSGAAIRYEIDSHKPLLGKVFALRNKVFAHRSTADKPEAVFGSAGLTPNQMRSVVSLAQQLVAELVDANGGDSRDTLLEQYHARACRVREQSQALLVRLHPDGR